ncbi:MAG: hypothetical protein QM820_44555 [Minicystis sp.]
MLAEGLFDRFPLWLLLGITIVVLLLAVEGGYLLGRRRRRSAEQEHAAHVLALVTTTMGLLALVLAFTFGFAATRFEARKHIVVDEANAVETTYLRAGLLPGDRGPKVRAMLREYVDLRLDVVRIGNVEETLRRSEELHRKMWGEAEAAGREQPGSVVVGLFIDSLSKAIELHATRVKVAVRSGVPAVLWAALLVIAILNLAAVGYHAGLVGTRRSPAVVTQVMSLSIVLILTADLDRPQEGTLRVSQQPMIDLKRMMGD